MVNIIAIEGIDSCGKTTLVQKLNKILPQSFSYREPGGCKEAEKIRLQIESSSNLSNKEISKLFAKARFLLLQDIFSNFYQNSNILFFDRFILSNLAYQADKNFQFDDIITQNKETLLFLEKLHKEKKIATIHTIFINTSEKTIKTRLVAKQKNFLDKKSLEEKLTINKKFHLGIDYLKSKFNFFSFSVVDFHQYKNLLVQVYENIINLLFTKKFNQNFLILNNINETNTPQSIIIRGNNLFYTVAIHKLLINLNKNLPENLLSSLLEFKHDDIFYHNCAIFPLKAEIIREIENFNNVYPVSLSHKYIIISNINRSFELKKAFPKFLKIIEEPNPYTVFIFTTVISNINKILPSVRSRSFYFNFETRQDSSDIIYNFLSTIDSFENKKIILQFFQNLSIKENTEGINLLISQKSAEKIINNNDILSTNFLKQNFVETIIQVVIIEVQKIKKNCTKFCQILSKLSKMIEMGFRHDTAIQITFMCCLNELKNDTKNITFK